MLIAKTLGPEEGYDMHGFAGAIDRTLRTVFPQVRASTAGSICISRLKSKFLDSQKDVIGAVSGYFCIFRSIRTFPI